MISKWIYGGLPLIDNGDPDTTGKWVQLIGERSV